MPIFSKEKTLTEQFAEAIEAQNWLRVRRLAHTQEMTTGELFEQLALSACYVHASGTEPKRSREWSALAEVIELVGFEAWADAVQKRHELETQ